MGHYCHTAIAKFIKHAVYNFDYCNFDKDYDLAKLLEPNGYYEGEYSTDEERKILKSQETITLVSFGGWTHKKYNDRKIKETKISCIRKDKGISGELWVKDNQKI